MEKENGKFLNCQLNWSAAEPPLTYALPGQLQQQQQCFLPQFDSTLSSIGHLEGFSDPMSVPVQAQQWSSAGCFGPRSLNSQSKLNLAMVCHRKQALPAGEPSDLVERAAVMPRLGVGVPNYVAKFPLSETGRLPGSRLAAGADDETVMVTRSSAGGDAELRCVRGESSASEHTASDSNSKRKRPFKVGEEGSGEVNAKRSKAAEATGGSGKDEVKPKVEVGGEEQKPAKAVETAEAPKQDYIHVRARRGQATDAHSLAERVRREKISERMKFLQNLVPGCNKVTGKAVMLDEIINYVQSLQRQVEFLSMKLATVNPRLDINVESLLQKDMHQPRGVYPMGTMALATFPFAHQPPPQGAHLQSIATSGVESHCPANPPNLMPSKRPLGVQPPILDGFSDDAGSQVGVFWEDDLHRVVQMGSGQNQEDMKIKL